MKEITYPVNVEYWLQAPSEGTANRIGSGEVEIIPIYCIGEKIIDDGRIYTVVDLVWDLDQQRYLIILKRYFRSVSETYLKE